mmetsp:Transcript_854/g.2559  ORF Transcript_854/g.2559 Transcript_854/m.2559 type:complete len:210 (-) Transcript_854:90-719(-)
MSSVLMLNTGSGAGTMATFCRFDTLATLSTEIEKGVTDMRTRPGFTETSFLAALTAVLLARRIISPSLAEDFRLSTVSDPVNMASNAMAGGGDLCASIDLLSGLSAAGAAVVSARSSELGVLSIRYLTTSRLAGSSAMSSIFAMLSAVASSPSTDLMTSPGLMAVVGLSTVSTSGSGPLVLTVKPNASAPDPPRGIRGSKSSQYRGRMA